MLLDMEENKIHSGPSEGLHFLKSEKSLNISLSNHNSLKSVLQKEKNVNFVDAVTHEHQHVFKEKDLGQNRFCAAATLTDKPHNDCEKVLSEKDPLPKEETASLPSSSASSGNAGSPAESCGGKPNSGGADSIVETKNGFEEAKQDNLDHDTNMEVDPSMVDALDFPAITSDDKESLKRSDEVTVIETENVAISKSSESLKDNSVTKNVSEVKTSHLKSCQSSPDTTAVKLQEKPENTRPSSSDGASGVSNINLQERLEHAALMQVHGEEDTITAQKTGNIDVTATDSNTHNKLTSFHKAPGLDMEDDGLLSVKEYSHFSSKTLSKMDDDIETSSAPLVSNSLEKMTVTVKLWEGQLSSKCLLKTPNTNTDIDTEHAAGSVQHGDMMEKAAGKEPSPVSPESGRTTSFIKDTSTTKRQTERSDTCGTMHKTQNSHIHNEEDCSPEGGVASAQSPEFIGHVLSEMGPPLPPVLTPLTTPPKAGKSINPRHAIGKLSFPSPMDCMDSPTTPTKAHLVPNGQQLNCSSLHSPTPSNSVPSSPLQFGSATPKHALPVPGRLPPKANSSSPSASASPPQENSMRFLDSMYPELSAQARTLSILRGNVSLSGCSSESRTLPTASDHQVSSFKTISSASTAFTKTELRGDKRPAVSLPQPENRKCPKLESSPADIAHSLPSSSNEETTCLHAAGIEQFKSRTEPDPVVNALEKIRMQCFDLLPVVQSHLYVGNLPKKPVLRDEEKEVISDICKSSSVSISSIFLHI